MVQEDDVAKTGLDNVWRTCNKIRAAIHRLGISLWDHFKLLDPKAKTLISGENYLYLIKTRNTILINM